MVIKSSGYEIKIKEIFPLINRMISVQYRHQFNRLFIKGLKMIKVSKVAGVIAISSMLLPTAIIAGEAVKI
ncbi:MAG: hypothetical protein P8I00_05035, partial [Methylophilaceae bacterium]|nr:hypothetical protein [Methylophilaceae bacterium]